LAFAVGVSVVISAALALTANGLRPYQEAARELDRQKNVMIAAGLIERSGGQSREQLERLYAERVEESVIDRSSGEPAAISPASLAGLEGVERDSYRLLITVRDEGGAPEAYVLPIEGKGLWSILHGYLALEADGTTVRGITFYEHGETPGLGGEVENPAWAAQWRGKKIFDSSGALVSITIKKGKVDPTIAAEQDHYVDGLSGATITSNGVTAFLKADLGDYLPFLRTIRAGRQG
jgi:Na+-transporting NADH:ubiquinone oxidoreductase subunit C